MFVIVDYGIGNLNSIVNSCNRLDVAPIVSSDPKIILGASKLLLPGVGHFTQCMKNLLESGLVATLEKKVFEQKTPLLGICVGMQMLTKKSEEGNHAGLGWIDAETVRFSFPETSDSMRIPHVGFNTVEHLPSALFRHVSEPRFYFTHSFHVTCANSDDVLGRTMYGYSFASAIHRDNIYGVQFHPEKSHLAGVELFKSFIEECR